MSDIDSNESISTSNSEANKANAKQQWERIMSIFATQLMSFRRTILWNRRQTIQRIRNRQRIHRNQYLHQMMSIQNEFLMQLPITATKKFIRDADSRFWEGVVPTYTDEQWLETFRMSRKTFHWICDRLDVTMRPNGASVPLKNLINLQKRVALSIYTLATGDDYRMVAELFGVSRTSVCKFIKRFADSIIEEMASFLLVMPQDEAEYDVIRQTFQAASSLPNVVGCLGFCLIPINASANNAELYAKPNGGTSITMQALIDDKLLFRKVSMVPNSPTMFMDSPQELIMTKSQPVGDRLVPSFVISPNQYYPLNSWLMQKYPNPQTPQQHAFNEAVDNVLDFKENAYMRLFARWRILQRKYDLEARTIEAIAMACCALHNLLEENEDGYREEWGDSVDTSKCNPTFEADRRKDSKQALKTRDYLTQTIYNSSEIQR
ncbi:uncharacterized protein LOC129951834 [Eupeodes corollae]|uniref:uncharacterized protein LOC129951834 n=1 Tax=Eupeodes corollae TaxID=290404 RepID=UPI002491C10F|nr:uncharacterized protein LOC129951834 [Eupeodes corollae]